MSTIELKERLIQKINTTKDSNILEEVYRLLEMGQNDTNTFYFNDYQREQTEASKKQIKEGQYLNNLEVDKEIEQCLA
jgi:hypothetical protein